MATTTSNYGFKKPEENDFYSIEDQNRNWDLADTKMAQLNSDLAISNVNSIKIATFISESFSLTAGAGKQVDIPLTGLSGSTIITAVANPIGGYPYAISIGTYTTTNVSVHARAESNLTNRQIRVIVFYK